MIRLHYVKLLIVFLISGFSAIASGQEFYYAYGIKKPLQLSSDKISIKAASGFSLGQVQAVLADESNLNLSQMQKLAGEKDAWTVGLRDTTKIKQFLQRIQQKPEIEIANPVYLINKKEVIPTDRFLVKFWPSVNQADIQALRAQYNIDFVEVSQADPYRYTFRVTGKSTLSVLEAAQKFHEKLPAKWAKPSFIRTFKRHFLPNDTYFPKQYYLDSSNDVDIDAPEAWNMTTGDASITIAIIDDGGEAHEDLPASRIVAGYDYVPPVNDSDPSPEGNESHGMSSAGIVAATQNNNKGISGVAPNCKVMFLRIFNKLGFPVSDSKIANAIDFAWMNGADVINNSWGGGTPSEDIDEALNRALTQGRNGKGCVVVFAAGNRGSIDYPADRPGVIAVGAVDQSNNVWAYSGKGIQLAVVAPSGETGDVGALDFCNAGQMNSEIILKGDVWSLDRAGQPGTNPGDYRICTAPYYYNKYIWTPPGGGSPTSDYRSTFSGTSASAPQVSGIAALILSINPYFEAKPSNPEVQDIIKKTADHPNGFGSFDTTYGYGRVNAHSAVVEASNPTGITNPPSAPANLVITNPNNIGQSPILNWSPSYDADCYYIYRRVSFYPDWLYMGATGSTSYTDNTLTIKSSSDPMADEFFYHVTAVNSGGESNPSNTASVWGFSFHKKSREGQDLPLTFKLEQNYPNPFNPTTEFRYAIPSEGYVELVISNLLGQTIRTIVAENQAAGQYSKIGDGKNKQGDRVASGVYLYVLTLRKEDESKIFQTVRKLSLLR